MLWRRRHPLEADQSRLMARSTLFALLTIAGAARRVAGARAVSQYLRQHLRQSAAASAGRRAEPAAVAVRRRSRNPARRRAAGGLPPGPPPGRDPDPAAAAAARRRPARRPRRAARSARRAAAGQRPAPQPQPASPRPPPPDEIIVEPPAQKIANPTAVFSGLDKITGRIISFDVAINETVRFGALEVTPRACYTRPPTESAEHRRLHRGRRADAAGRDASASSPAGCSPRARG